MQSADDDPGTGGDKQVTLDLESPSRARGCMRTTTGTSSVLRRASRSFLLARFSFLTSSGRRLCCIFSCADFLQYVNFLSPLFMLSDLSTQIHKDDVRPNFHCATHMIEQIRDYGPVYGFWLFSFERMNRVLKSINTNNRAGGEIETTYMHGFTKEVRRLHVLMRRHMLAGDSLESLIGSRLLTSDRDYRGTLSMKVLSNEPDNTEDGEHSCF